MNSLFLTTRDERVARARQRYFEEGVVPSGVVSDAIFQSWTRCHRAQRQPEEHIAFQAVSASRSQLALQKNRLLHAVWLTEMPSLLGALAATRCSAILTDPSGVLIGATPLGHAEHHIMRLAHRVGVNLCEEDVGTTAPGIVARTGQAASVLGSEHYFDAVRTMHCTAAPIRNIRGQMAGILDISSEGVPFTFDPSSVVGLYAASIENRLLLAQSEGLFIVKFQCLPSIIDTPMVGMLGFDLAGKWLWANAVASKLLGISAAKQAGQDWGIDALFTERFEQLASCTDEEIRPAQLRNGLQVFVRCTGAKPGRSINIPFCLPADATVGTHSQASDAADVATPSHPSTGGVLAKHLPASSLKQADADLIHCCLQAHRGNVSQVARQLKVSRGLIYRRLQDLGIERVPYKTH